MAQPFFKRPSPAPLAEIADLSRSELLDPARRDQVIRGLAALNEAGPAHLTFFDNLKYVDQLKETKAGACLVSPRFADKIPSHVAVLQTKKPFQSFVTVARAWYAETLRPSSWFGNEGVAPSAVVDKSARLEEGVIVDPLAVIGPHVEIGSGSVVGAHAVIGSGVKIGRNCNIGSGCSIQATLIGNNVLIHPGCLIGQDGFGFIFDIPTHPKVPQTGRVLIQNDVEIGAGTTIDRGSLRDTIVGEGTKIDNQVQIGHNVVIGRYCLIAAQCGLAGSMSLGDNVVLAAKVGLNNHIHVGDGAQVAAMSAVKDSIPAGGRWGGFFARPSKQWLREMLVVERLARGQDKAKDEGEA